MNRRDLLKLSCATSAATLVGCSSVEKQESQFRKSFVTWCYNKHWTLEQQIMKAKFFGVEGLEFVPPKKWELLKSHNLECSMIGSHGYTKGMNNKLHWAECHDKLTTSINNASAAKFKNVISFTGFYDTSKQKGSVVGFQ